MSLEMHEEEEDARTLSDSTLLRFTTKTEKREKRAVTSLTEHILSVTNENIYPVAQESQRSEVSLGHSWSTQAASPLLCWPLTLTQTLKIWFLCEINSHKGLERSSCTMLTCHRGILKPVITQPGIFQICISSWVKKKKKIHYVNMCCVSV